jgi:hypothetical protein
VHCYDNSKRLIEINPRAHTHGHGFAAGMMMIDDLMMILVACTGALPIFG